MKQRVTTQTGSVYVIDTEAKTWHRMQSTENSGTLRTHEGTFNTLEPLEVGKGLTMYMDTLPTSAPGTLQRLVYTSDIVNIEPFIEGDNGRMPTKL